MRSWMFLVPLLLAGCGYTSAAHYAKNVVGERVSTEVVISMEDPQNTVLIKDAVDRAVITRFHTTLVPKAESQTHLKIAIESVNFIPLRYDVNGYIITYRTEVALKIDRTRGETSVPYRTHGYYDFIIEPNAIITDQARYEAIAQGAEKGIDAFIAQIAAEGSSPRKEQP